LGEWLGDRRRHRNHFYHAYKAARAIVDPHATTKEEAAALPRPGGSAAAVELPARRAWLS
jgi:hypothetical protein